MTITVETTIEAPVDVVWTAYTSPDDIMQWNAASDDWHTPSARVDLREGGDFSWRMEAKDGSAGFDFAGTYTKIVPNERIDYEFGGRKARIDFAPEGRGTRLRIAFDPETEHSFEMQRDGWRSILDNFKRHVERRRS